MTRRKKLEAGCLVVFAAFALLACLRTRSEQQTSDLPSLRVWAMGKEGEYLARRMATTEVQGMRVQVQRIPWSAAHEKLLTAFVAGTLPDVVQIGSTWIAELAAVGALHCNDYEEFVGDFFPGAVEASRFNGALCAVPWYIDTRVLFYRRDLLAQAGYWSPPATWEEWRAAMRAVRNLSENSYGLLAPLNEWHLPVALALQLGAPLLREQGTRGDFQNPAFQRAFSFYVSLFHEGLAPFSGEAQVANVYQDFASGLFTFFVTGPWNLGEFRRRLPPELDTAWFTAPLPVPALGMPSVSVAGGASLGVVRNTPNRAAALEFIRKLLTVEEQVELYRTTGDLPVRRSAWESPRLLADARLEAFRRQLEHARAAPSVPEWERIAGLLVQYVELAVRKRLEVNVALRRLDADVDRVLEKRRWLLQRSTHGK